MQDDKRAQRFAYIEEEAKDRRVVVINAGRERQMGEARKGSESRVELTGLGFRGVLDVDPMEDLQVREIGECGEDE
jgi:hypothetical protein